MRSSLKSMLVLTTALTIALTSLDPRPVAAAPEGGPAIVKQNAGEFEFGAARKRRRYRGNPAIPLAAFGAIIGTIGSIAAAQSRPAYYYDDGPYVDGPVVYDQPYVYDEPTYYASPTYVAPGGYAPYRHRGFVSPGPAHRPFVGHAPAARQFVQRNFVRPQGGGRPGARVGAPGGRPHARH
jgi:hypothetical protein